MPNASMTPTAAHVGDEIQWRQGRSSARPNMYRLPEIAR